MVTSVDFVQYHHHLPILDGRRRSEIGGPKPSLTCVCPLIATCEPICVGAQGV